MVEVAPPPNQALLCLDCFNEKESTGTQPEDRPQDENGVER